MSDCIFCKIASKEIPSKVIYEDEFIIAFNDIEPQAPTHVVIIPKEHIQSLQDVSCENKELLGHILLCIKDIAKDLGLEDGYRLVSNCGQLGGQTVDHLHFHLLGGRNLQWPPG